MDPPLSPPSRHQFLEHPQFDWGSFLFFLLLYVLVLTFFSWLPMKCAIIYLLRHMPDYLSLPYLSFILADDLAWARACTIRDE